MGFYVTRWVEAENTEAARRLVLEQEWSELAVRGWADKGGRLFVDEIEIVDGTEAGANDQGWVLFRETTPEGSRPGANESPPFLLITRSGFSLQNDPLAETWMVTPTAMDTLRGALCFSASGEAQRIIDVVPLQPLRLHDRLRPWRRVPTRLVLQSAFELPLIEVRRQMVVMIQGDSAVAESLTIPIEEAVVILSKADTPLALIEAVARITATA